MHPDFQELTRIITTALAEDIGRGDLTSDLTIDALATTSFSIAAREPMVVSGILVAFQVFKTVDNSMELEASSEDGQHVTRGTVLLRGKGRARSLLAAERVALNLLQHMSGIATLTHRYVEQTDGTKTKILDTRKTTPGLREIEKYAVRCGGGYNHRLRLDDGILIKDNHIAIAGGLTIAVQKAKAGAPSPTKVEVECDTLAQVDEALRAGADVIMLDNMSISQVKEAVQKVAGRIPLEVSGGVSLEHIRGIAETGVDFISIGKLTHSAPSVDIGLDIP